MLSSTAAHAVTFSGVDVTFDEATGYLEYSGTVTSADDGNLSSIGLDFDSALLNGLDFASGSLISSNLVQSRRVF